MREAHPQTVVVQQSPVLEVSLVAAGVVIGWFLAMTIQASRGAIRQSPNGRTPPALGPTPRDTGKIGFWRNGVQWSNMTAFNAVEGLSDLEIGATQDEINAIMADCLKSSQEAHAFADREGFNDQAIEINRREGIFNRALTAKQFSLIGGDITGLKNSAAQLKKTGEELPSATDKLKAIDSYLNVLGQLINLV